MRREEEKKKNPPPPPPSLTHIHTLCRCNVIRATQRITLVSSALSLFSSEIKAELHLRVEKVPLLVGWM
ncbi:cyclin-Y-like [Platysternon megacephalum]|uniref:Cyclin-Y-like n=1 Tax=Platysternon megacephalum TaxID=55544 RepID=A0A4D9EN54_9SAUR|nr:cyclin-Y-like [Platysternon megacephalum]